MDTRTTCCTRTSTGGPRTPLAWYTKNGLLRTPPGKVIEGLYTAWIRLNNPAQYNSYTTEMVKGVIAGFENASLDRSVVCVVFTGTGPYAFCTGGNTREYSEYYSMRCDEYGQYMELFNHMVDAILTCKKPTICRVNGMRVAGGQEIGMACDISGLLRPRRIRPGRTPARIGARRAAPRIFCPGFSSAEDAMWNCVSCEMWSAYKMKMKDLVTKVVPVLKVDGKWVRNPTVICGQIRR